LADLPHKPSLVVTPPDRRQGRGRHVLPPPAAELAAELGIELLQVENVNEADALERIRAARPEAVVVCAFGQLIREPLLSAFPILNVHPSLLPRWRGAAPIERAIMAGDRSTGVCIMRLTEGLDSGPVALREEVPLGCDEDFQALSETLAALGGKLLVKALDLEAEGRLEFSEQDEAGATYAEKIDPAERRLDPSRPATELAAAVRGLTPHVGAYLEMAGEERLGVRKARAVDVSVKTGAVKSEQGALLIGCCRGALRLDEVQPAGGKPMPVDAYLRGHSLPQLP
jgi:methionyl-tRNA formyltransferase